MRLFEASVVLAGAAILVAGLFYARKIVRILRRQQLARPWIYLSCLIAFFYVGYAFTAVRFLNFNLLPWVANETIVAFLFFFGAIFVAILTYLNKNLFTEIFGLELTDAQALQRFARYANLGRKVPLERLRQKYTLRCDGCKKEVSYSIMDIVRSHPRLKRGIVIDEAMGSRSYVFYLRHRCKDGLREIPVLHDAGLEYRSQRPSRVV